MIENIKEYLKKFTDEQLSAFTDEQIHEFRTLPESYTVDQFYKYKLLKRGQKCVIYQGFFKDSDKPSIYEVFMIKIAKPSIVKLGAKSLFVPTREKMPSNEDFGKFALSLVSLEESERIFNHVESGGHINQSEN